MARSKPRPWIVTIVLLATALPVAAAPDEEKLGKSLGYPVAKFGNNKDWYHDESVRVGSFTHQAEIPGLREECERLVDRSVDQNARVAGNDQSARLGRWRPGAGRCWTI